MKPRSKQAFLLLVLFAAGCSAIYDVSYDYDREVDLTRLRSYACLPMPKELATDELVVGRVKRAVDAEMEEKGIRTASDDPDFLIAMHVGSEEKVSYQDWGYSYGGYWRRGGTSKFKYQEGNLVLDFVDAESKQLIWRGQAKGFVDRKSNPKKDEKLVNEAVRKILKNFPPR